MGISRVKMPSILALSFYDKHIPVLSITLLCSVEELLKRDQDLSLYLKEFEAPFLASSLTFYETKAALWREDPVRHARMLLLLALLVLLLLLLLLLQKENRTKLWR